MGLKNNEVTDLPKRAKSEVLLYLYCNSVKAFEGTTESVALIFNGPAI